MRFFYYPGCSLEATAKEYDRSVRVVCRELGIDLVESEDWCCCGSSSAHNINHKLSIALPAHNLALAQQAGLDIIAPCAACYNRLKRVAKLMQEDEKARQDTEEITGSNLSGTTRVYSFLEALTEAYSIKEIAGRVKRPLTGLKLVCYYGCMLVRPPEVTGSSHFENPMAMDNLMAALGADVKQWSYKTDCCGAFQGIVNAGFTTRLVDKLLAMALEAGAEAVVTSCPLCQSNLEMRRNRSFNIPSFYFTELTAIALGVPVGDLWLAKHLIDPTPLLNSLFLAS